MLELVKAGGWLMAPIVACSVLALAIIAERLWALREQRVMPDNLLAEVWALARSGRVAERQLAALQNSPLGRILSVGLLNQHRDRQVMKDSIEEAGRHAAHELERFLSALGTIASITPLLGLLGTVIGMIAVFTTITSVGVGNPTELAGGISKALITTAGGLGVAIPSLIFYRYFRAKVDALVMAMEQEAIKLVQAVHGERSQESVLAGQR